MLFRERQLMNSFKPGDWIKSTRYPNLRPVQITSIYESNTRPGILGLKSKGTVLYSDEVELWHPKPNEWCWFWNKDMDTNQSPRLAQFHLMTEELQKPMDFPAFYQTKYKATKLGYLYDFCEPFIGQLPTHLKDQS